MVSVRMYRTVYTSHRPVGPLAVEELVKALTQTSSLGSKPWPLQRRSAKG